MKPSLIVIFAVFCIAIVGIPEVSGSTVNWDRAYEILVEVEGIASALFNGVFQASWEENKLVATNIKAIIIPIDTKVRAALTELRTSVKLHKLTSSSARETYDALLADYQLFLEKLSKDIQPLSKETQEKIKFILDSNFAKSAAIFEELYTVLP